MKKDKKYIEIKRDYEKVDNINRIIGFILYLIIFIVFLLYISSESDAKIKYVDLTNGFSHSEFLKRTSEKTQPKLFDKFPVRDLIKNCEPIRNDIILCTSYDWPNEICYTKLTEDIQQTKCVKLEEK
jgi:hypothetical protein